MSVHWILSHIRGGVTQIARLAEIASAYVPVAAVLARQQAIRTVTLVRQNYMGGNSDAGGSMAGRDQSKEASLAASRTLNPHPEGVTDPAFTSGAFFDARDRSRSSTRWCARSRQAGRARRAAASAFGLPARLLHRAASAGRARAGRPGPGQAGPRGRAQADGGGVDSLGQQHAAADPAPSSAQLAAAVADQFGVTVHKRSVERALAARRAAGNQHRRRQKPLAPRPQGRRRAPLRSLAPTSSCAVSPPAASAAAGGTGQRYWPPRGWRPGWPPRPRGPPHRPPADRRDGAAAQAQAERSPSAPDQSLPAISAEGGESAGSACPALSPAATSQLIAVWPS